MAYSKTCLLFLVFAALLLLSSISSARELADQTLQSVQPESVEEGLHRGHLFHGHHHHHHDKHKRKHHKKPGHGHGHGGTGDAGEENMGSEMEDGEN